MPSSPVISRRHSSHEHKSIQTPKIAPDPEAFKQTSFSEKKRTNYEGKRCPVAPSKSPLSSSGGILLSNLQQRFEFFNEIGEGDFSKVYKVREKISGRLYALKGLKPKGFRKSDVRRAQKEFEIGHLLSPHPNCLHYMEYFSNWQNTWILMELCETSLEKYIVSCQLSELNIWRLFADVACGLAHVHGHGFIHFDIKPANVLLSRDELSNTGDFIAKIGDFGLIRRKDEWQFDDCEGDKYYMAPELLESDSSAITGAADVFSLGVMLLEMSYDLNLRECDWQLLREGKFFQLLEAEFKPRISLELRRMIQIMMSPNPSDRPTALQLIQTPCIRPFLRKISPSPRILSPGTTFVTPVNSKGSKWEKNGTGIKNNDISDGPDSDVIVMKKNLLDDFNDALFD